MKNHMLLNLLFIFMVAFQFGCTNKMNAQSSSGNISQGIQGKVLWLEGNMMPTINEGGDVPKQKGVPIKREVHIYELTQFSEANSNEGFYTSLPTELIKKVE